MLLSFSRSWDWSIIRMRRMSQRKVAARQSQTTAVHHLPSVQNSQSRQCQRLIRHFSIIGQPSVSLYLYLLFSPAMFSQPFGVLVISCDVSDSPVWSRPTACVNIIQCLFYIGVGSEFGQLFSFMTSDAVGVRHLVACSCSSKPDQVLLQSLRR